MLKGAATWQLFLFAVLSVLVHVSSYGGAGDAGGDYDYYGGDDGDQVIQPESPGGSSAHPPRILNAAQQSADELSRFLLTGYNSERRPYFSSQQLIVEVELAVIEFVEVSTSREFIEIEAWWRFWWNDPRLSWNSSYWGIESLTLTDREIWTPDVMAFEHIADDETKTNSKVYANGRVQKSTPRKTKIGCPMDLQSFPFDYQQCTFTVGSWSENGLDLDVIPRVKDVSELLVKKKHFPHSSPLDMSSYIQFNSWQLAATKVVWKENIYACCPEPYPVLVYQFQLIRSSRTHFTGIIGPMILVTLVAFAVLLMPAPSSGSRPAISITMMLTSVTVYFVASRSTPQSMQSTAVGRLYAAGIVMCSLNVFNSILATALNLISPEEKVSNQALMDFFNAFDKDDSGVLERGELEAVFAILGITEQEKADILKVVEDSRGNGSITIEKWKAVAELTMDDSDRGSYHNFLVKWLVRLGLTGQLRTSLDRKSIRDAVRSFQEKAAREGAASPAPVAASNQNEAAPKPAEVAVSVAAGRDCQRASSPEEEEEEEEPWDRRKRAAVVSVSNRTMPIEEGPGSPPPTGRSAAGGKGWAAGKKDFFRRVRGNKGIEALGQKLKEYTAVQSNAQKMGKKLSATIDAWMLRLVLPAYVIYLLMEYAGVFTGRPVQAFQMGMAPPPPANQVQHDFFDYRSQQGVVRHYHGVFWTANRTTPVDMAYMDLDRQEQAEL